MEELKNVASLLLLLVAVMYVANFISILLSKLTTVRLTSMMDPSIEEALDWHDRRKAQSSLRVYETSVLYQAYLDGLERVQGLASRLVDLEWRDKLQSASAQVAHDIRSPLAALRVISTDLGELPEGKRILIRSAIQRIEDIANDLATKPRSFDANPTQPESVIVPDGDAPYMDVYLMSAVVESLVSEKRLRYRPRQEIFIQALMDRESYGLFARVPLGDFKRVLSNLINNGVEALGEEGGQIDIFLRQEGQRLKICVQDNGVGMAPELVQNIFQSGFSFGKGPDAPGLGLAHGRELLQRWGGDIRVESKVGRGSLFVVDLPIASPPEWFLGEIPLYPSETLVVIDDDESIHEIWNTRLDEIQATRDWLIGFRGDASFRRWLEVQPWRDEEWIKRYVFMFDYELLGSSKTGLDLIKEFGLQRRSVLVTSRYEDPEILDRCQSLRLKLLPKPLAGFVPVFEIPEGSDPKVYEVKAPSPEPEMAPAPKAEWRQSHDVYDFLKTQAPLSGPLDYVLVDDSVVNQKLWTIIAKQKDLKIKTFGKSKDFWDALPQISKATPIYFDSNLGPSERGEDLAKQVFELGYENLYLATGYGHEDFPSMPWIKAVVGKTPPFAAMHRVVLSADRKMQ